MMSQPEDASAKPTGPVIPPGEVLRRSVPEAATDAEGMPTSSAFIRSTHDAMMSTLRSNVSGHDTAARWTGRSQLAGVWPVETTHLHSHSQVAYADGGQPCGCGASDCAPYPADHASVDLRGLSRGRREKLAQQMKIRARELGPIYLV
jgi:hypothetical protein